jgi:hypothetical protein
MKIINFDHLSQVEETYFQHLKFGVWAGIVLTVLGTISLVHAIFPFFLSRWPDRIYRYFVRLSSSRMDRVNRILKEKNIEL